MQHLLPRTLHRRFDMHLFLESNNEIIIPVEIKNGNSPFERRTERTGSPLVIPSGTEAPPMSPRFSENVIPNAGRCIRKSTWLRTFAPRTSEYEVSMGLLNSSVVGSSTREIANSLPQRVMELHCPKLKGKPVSSRARWSPITARRWPLIRSHSNRSEREEGIPGSRLETAREVPPA